MSELKVQIEKIIEEANTELKRKVMNEIDTVAKETVSELKKTSPKKTGKYRKGWKFKKTAHGAIVFNEKYGNLTHLLEFGHDVIIKGKRKGRTKPIPHIKNAEKKAIDKLMQRISNL